MGAQGVDSSGSRNLTVFLIAIGVAPGNGFVLAVARLGAILSFIIASGLNGWIPAALKPALTFSRVSAA